MGNLGHSGAQSDVEAISKVIRDLLVPVLHATKGNLKFCEL